MAALRPLRTVVLGAIVALSLASGAGAAPRVTIVPAVVKPGKAVQITITGTKCGAGKNVWVRGKPVQSGIRRNGLGEVLARPTNQMIWITFTVPKGTPAGSYPITLRCAATTADRVGKAIPGVNVVVRVG